MKQLFKGSLQVAIALLLLAALAVPAMGQTPIKVTFVLNTSTNLDTLTSKHFVQIRGAQNGKTGAVLPGGKTINWDGSSDLILTNVGGDYWKGTFEMMPDDTLNYKFWTGYANAGDKGTTPDGGWEGPFNPSNGINTDTRTFISGSKDTTLDVQYYHPNVGGAKVDQYFRPFASKPDSVAIYFRVNMGGVTEAQRFDPAVNGPVGVRGDDVKSGKVLDWGTTKVILKRETNSIDKGSFWSGVAYFPKTGPDAVQAGSEQNYKFFINNATGDAWEGGNNRTFKYPVGLRDTTLGWVYFDRLRPTGRPFVQATITFRLNLRSLQEVGLFDQGKGDRVAVIGAKGWDRPANYIPMSFNPLLQEWTVAEPFNLQVGTSINYKYFVIWDPSRTKAGDPNFIDKLSLDDGWEEPAVQGGGNRVYEYGSTTQQTPPGDFGRAQHFFNSVLPEGVIKTPISVTWNVDMKPAADRATNPVKTLFRPGQDSVFIYIDDPLWAVTQGRRPQRAGRYELKDPDNDGVYSGTFDLKTPVWYQVGYIVAYTTTTGVETNGGGFDKGRRYYQFVKPASISSTGPTWPATYNFPTVPWKENNLPVEDPPLLITAVQDKPIAGAPTRFELAQNYPNPFNPVTKITYQVARTTGVKIGVYNLMGQLVKTLINETLAPGKYSTIWAGDNAQGQSVPTGIYFLKMEAGDFTKVRKMALLR
jgi:hypothetical protein